MKKILFSLAFLVGLALNPFDQAVADSSIVVEALMGSNEQSPNLLFKMKNVSKTPIAFYKADLPWGNRYSILIIAISGARQNILPVTHPIDDPRPDTITINPGEELQGEIRLDRYVEGFDRSLKSDDLLVFWHYDAKAKDGKSVGEFGGWLRALRSTTTTTSTQTIYPK